SWWSPEAEAAAAALGPVAPSAASVATPPSPPSPTAAGTAVVASVQQPAAASSSLVLAAAPSLVSAKDSRWLQLEVCREYQRNKCSRQDAECKFAHPPPNVEVQNGRVIACYDSIKGRCNREKPPCKYFHPPQHLKDQLLINGRNHLALKNALLQQMPLQAMLPGQLPTAAVVSPYWYLGHAQRQQQLHQQQQQQQQQSYALFNGSLASAKATSPYMPALTTMATASSFGHYLTPSPVLPGMMTADAVTAPLSVMQASLVSPQKVARTDRLEREASSWLPHYWTGVLQPAHSEWGLKILQHVQDASSWRIADTVCREFQRGTCKRPETECRFGHPPEHVAVDTGDGAVTVCMDFVKGRCSRDQCRYFHPPPHLQAQLKATQSRAGAAAAAAAAMATEGGSADVGLQMYTQPGLGDPSASKKRPRESADEVVLALPGLVPYTKRPALDKSGVPVYQPSATAYQQALALQMQQPFVPVSFTGHPAGVPRF
ncbi:muscleblind-like protein 2a, partial [Haemaphysalis longicornis]